MLMRTRVWETDHFNLNDIYLVHLFLQLRRSARANHGTAEISSKTHAASNDHIKIPSTEPCCKLSPLVVAPIKKPVHRSSRLRARKGRDGAKTEPTEEMEAAEWVSRVLENNGTVEVDPVTMAELSAGKADTTNTHNRIASLTTSSEVPDYFPPRGSAFPRFPGVPFEVAIAAGENTSLIQVNCESYDNICLKTLN